MNKKFIWIFTIFFIVYISIGSIAGFYTDYEWFRINNGTDLFWTLFLTKFNVQFLFAALFIVLFILNFLLIRLLGGKGRIFTNNILDRIHLPLLGSPKRALFIVLAIAVVVAGIIMGGGASSYWQEYLLFKNAMPFTGFPKDPIFNLDMGFYVFSLPFYQFVYGWLMSSLLIITIFSIVFHFINRGIFLDGKLEMSLFARAHISTLLAAVVFLLGLGYRLSAYELLFSKIGKFFGAGYTAVNANLIAYNVAMGISFIAAALLIFNIFKRSFKLPLIVMATLLPAYFLIGTVYPALQQRFIVEPNELSKEKPYIMNNIKFTRLAYDIERVKEVPFKNSTNLNYSDILKNRTTLENVRLWDWRPLKQTYKQLQELKRYYYFNDVDVDRYIVNGKKIAVNLAARELSIDSLSKNSRTWQNTHLIYTHGYGIVMNRVDKITDNGQPEFIINDIPPKTREGFKLDRPEVYYGEHNNSYVISNTSINPGEFDYPSGDENKYTTYEGKGGTKLDSVFKRLMFAVAYGDINILISGNINKNSRFLYRRNIQEMASTFTPFLKIDTNPYLVISGGKLYWITDAYTVSDQFPYSTPVEVNKHKINYMRNSVKIVIDAYNGEMKYYISDSKDPLIQAYSKMFPGIFKDIKELSKDLQTHIRYPSTLFDVQSHMLLTYHMQDPNVFYNNEDAWHIARQVYEDTEEQVSSYYLVTRLPDEKRDEFISIVPFTPYQKNNMIAFLTAKCDMENFGELKLYTLPKEKLSYGPLQIEARINQDAEISKQLTLWGQKGSKVIRGNMLAIPIEESLVFIEPLYLKAETSEMPELKRVIVSFADKIVMEKDLNTALEKLFYKGGFSKEEFETDKKGKDFRKLAERAYSHFLNAEKSIKAGNWSEYGENLKRLREILIHMKQQEKK